MTEPHGSGSGAVWTTSYLAALGDPTGTPDFVPFPLTFSGQTVRQWVRLRRGGSALRVVLSNEFGAVPLVLDRVTAGTGPAAPVTLGGQARWEIPPGRSMASDPVERTTSPGEELAVSCYVAGTAASSAFQFSAQRLGEVAPGDQAGADRLDGVGPVGGLYWITEVRTDAPATGPVVVALGDSITRGDGTTDGADRRYPDVLQRRLLDAGAAGAVVLNAGISANQLLRPGFGPAMVDRFDRDVLARPEVTHVVVLGGINDIGNPDRPRAEEIVAGLTGLARRAADRGIRPVLGTITPFADSGYESFRADGNERVWRAVNDALRAQGEWPVADFAAALASPDDPARLAPPFDSGDGVHPSDAGAEALAGAVDLALLTG